MLYFYELCLLGAALFIVLWRNVTDDAVVLLVLMAVFLGIGGIALETIAYDDTTLAFTCGLLFLALGGLKLWAIRRWLAPRINTVVLGVVFLVLAHGYLGPVAFAKLNCTEDGLALRPGWLAGWWILALAVAILYVTAEVLPCGNARRSGTADRDDGEDATTPVPFAFTRGMGWVFVAVLLGMAVLHQFGVAHLFGEGGDADGFPWSWSDLLPFAGLGLLLAVQYRRLFGCGWGRCDEALLVLPALGIAVGLGIGSFEGVPGLNAELIGHPAVVSALIAVAVGRKAWVLNRDIAWATTILYAALAVLVLNPLPGGGASRIFWLASGAVFAAGLVLMAVLTRKIGWAVAAAIAAGAGGFAVPTARATAGDAMLASFGLGLVAKGIALWMLHLAFTHKCPRALALLAPAVLLVGIMCLFKGVSPTPGVATVVVAAVLMGVIVWLRSRDRVAAVMYGGASAWQGFQLMRTNFDWGCITLAFVLLAAGVVLSLRKGTCLQLKALPEDVKA